MKSTIMSNIKKTEKKNYTTLLTPIPKFLAVIMNWKKGDILDWNKKDETTVEVKKYVKQD